MKLISWWGCGTIDQPLISGDKIVEFGIADLEIFIHFLEYLLILVRSQNLLTVLLSQFPLVKDCGSLLYPLVKFWIRILKFIKPEATENPMTMMGNVFFG
jgi:hypothetical protein